ncbi:type II toxin-antitoxin system HicA family toxin [Devosia salina]|uniref:type II toxin-antitoxin system HicA family toxin n=1 Tax=Devosia salina TaxID=2860336 RepID=UPI001F0B53BA|nr:type II toxin-antitoxin system HicA family toxin [Devosia salina]
MVRGFYAEIVTALREAGCVYRRAGKGDHEIWDSPATQRSFTVDKSYLSRHTANAVMKQAGIDKKF